MQPSTFSCEEEKLVEHALRIFQFICGRPSTRLKLLDLGCGSGKIVYEFRKRNVDAYGADFELPPENTLPKMETPAFRKIDKENYRIPFEDESFDLVFSNEVLEHVSDHLKLFAEIARVLKSGGASLHFFPPRYSPLEVHTHVPMAGVFQQYSYLLFWALLGIRNQFQKQMGWIETARFNRQWLSANTNYISRNVLIKSALPYFYEVRLLDRDFLRLSPGRPGRYYSAIRLFPFSFRIYSALRKRALLLKSPIPTNHT